MKIKINEYFEGSINGVKFNNEESFLIVGDILNCLEDSMDTEIDSNEVVKILKQAAIVCYTNGYSMNDFEKSCITNIGKGHKAFLPKPPNSPYKGLNMMLMNW